VQIQVLGLDTQEAMQVGAAVEPTVAVGDILVAVGQPPMAGHLLRAVEATLERDDR
jgi:hypothetical protein